MDGSGLAGRKSGLKVDRSGLSATAKAVLDLLENDPTMTYDEISRRQNKARSGIAKHIKNLREKGYIK